VNVEKDRGQQLGEALMKGGSTERGTSGGTAQGHETDTSAAADANNQKTQSNE